MTRAATNEEWDVVVVGGGPGGSTTAGLLAKSGHAVLLLEKETFPRYQIGESLLPATIHGVCELLGVADAVHAAGFVKKNGGTFRWGKNEEPWTFGFGTARVNQELDFSFAYQVERAKFDALLLDRARELGVEVVERATVDDVVTEGDRVVGVRWRARGDEQPRVAKARYVVDASGNQSGLHRAAGERTYSEFFRNLALFAYFENGGRLPAPNAGNIFSVAFEYGWFWYIPLSDTLTSVGAVVAREHADKLKGDLDAAMRSMIDACAPIQRLLAGATRVTSGMYGEYRVRRDYSYSNTRFWRPGLALVGDAACFIDPVFSSGVHLATYSALLAARSIATFLAGKLPEAECMDVFEARYRKEFAVFYDFLLTFYDMHRDESSYFWTARKVLGSDEASNHAFLQLVAGAGTTADEFMSRRKNVGQSFQAYVDYVERRPVAVSQLGATVKTARRIIGTAKSLIDEARGEAAPAADGDGFGVTDDGLYWRRIER